MNNKGVSIITLIITIIVMIILASIAIVENSNATRKATLAKFKSEFSDFSELTKNEYYSKISELSAGNTKKERSKIYYMIASGKDYDEVKKTPTDPAGTVSDLTIDILGEPLVGNEYYEIVDDTNITGVSKHKEWYSSTEKHYVTDEGNVFILPGFLEEDEGVYKWWINEHSYYIATTSEGVGGTPVTPGGKDDPDVPSGGSQETIVITGNKVTLGGVEIEALDINAADVSAEIQNGFNIYMGSVVKCNGELYITKTEYPWVGKGQGKNSIPNDSNFLKLNTQKGLVTPSASCVEGDIKVENGELYVFRPYSFEEGFYNRSDYWIKILKEPNIVAN